MRMRNVFFQTVIRRNTGIVSKKVGPDWIILEPKKTHIRKLNDTAGFIWSRTARPIKISSIIRAVIREYGIPEQEALRDCSAFIRAYIQNGILVTK